MVALKKKAAVPLCGSSKEYNPRTAADTHLQYHCA